MSTAKQMLEFLDNVTDGMTLTREDQLVLDAAQVQLATDNINEAKRILEKNNFFIQFGNVQFIRGETHA